MTCEDIHQIIRRRSHNNNPTKMFVKFAVLFFFVAAASASDLSSFAYSVADPNTGDFKNQIESRVGDNVQGQYSLLESDGTRRTVDYAAGAEGFNAVVRKDPALIAAAPVIAPYPYAYASPYAFAKYGSFGYAAPYSYGRIFY
ncbi:larval/pupal rigid cuticle protein 66 [Manduca sexta]|uniref:larval/pupal rigid cuticle protein 66 n=1 Tax=Manduca sexta TaxID=7130 RepID=UPI00189049E9|nr:larval/pupal rigid cuticle protein 66 [Manduca sexta]